jgi:chromosome segregation ATPase
MLTRIVSMILIGLCIAACESKKISQLQKQNDSLRHELVSRNAMLKVMYDANALLDSIDLHRKALKEAANEPFHHRFSARLQEIHEYIKRSEKQITNMQNELHSSRNEASAYLMLVDALKGEVGIRDGEIETLADSVDHYETTNFGLSANLTAQEQAIENLYVEIREKQQKLSLLEEKVSELVKLTEAEAYYARGMSVEEEAEKIKFAPVRRKETFREALELYKKSYSLGKKEARAKVLEIQKVVSAESSLVAGMDANDPSE